MIGKILKIIVTMHSFERFRDMVLLNRFSKVYRFRIVGMQLLYLYFYGIMKNQHKLVLDKITEVFFVNICIIPARGGSKRIPRKNIKQFGGKPMIEWSISAAFKADCFDRILVSTDDIEIANFSESVGAEVPFIRPSELSEDYTPTGAVVKHALEWLQLSEIEEINACCLYATAPFITPNDIRESLSILDPKVCDFVLAVTNYASPVQRALVVDEKKDFGNEGAH